MRQYPHRGSLFMTDMAEAQTTPINYSKSETRRIVEMMSSDRALECPKCNDILVDVEAIEPPGSRSNVVVVNCHSCNRMAFLPDEIFSGVRAS